MIAIVDYGLGNVLAFKNIYKRFGIEATVAKVPEDLLKASKIILPGVGSFDWAMTKLNNSGLRAVLDKLVLKKKLPVLGVCVGMQMMAKKSEEGVRPGLGWIDADVVKFDNKSCAETPVPHMGWNSVVPRHEKTLFCMVKEPKYYFLHSFFIRVRDENSVLSTSCYNISFCSAINFGNVYGTQFHPEKSHQWGEQLLKNFAEIC